MKTHKIFFVAIIFLAFLNSCKKGETKPAQINNNPTLVKNAAPALVGKWLVTKDSIQTYSSGVLVPNLVQPPSFDSRDFITFNADSTADVSNAATFSAFYTSYQATNATGILSVNNISPNLHFNYSVVFEGYSINSSASQSGPQPVYGLTAKNIVAGLSMGYGITRVSATTIILEHDLELPTTQHDFKIEELVYLSK